jgi:uncharacterized Zn finger protein
MRLNPFTAYRPVRTADGEGGFTEAYKIAEKFTVYLVVSYHREEIQASARDSSPVMIGDAILIDSAYYRVKSMEKSPGETLKRLALERIETPINPEVP